MLKTRLPSLNINDSIFVPYLRGVLVLVEYAEQQKILLGYLNAHEGCTQEYPLLKYLEGDAIDFFRPLGESPSLFKKHFYLFHHLYRLEQIIAEQNLSLIISPLEIRLISKKGANWAIGETDPLKAFYLNLDNLNLSDQEIAELQQKFWEKFLAIEDKANAIKCLGLQHHEDLDRATIKKRFNQLSAQLHPDKGGDANRFIEVKQAYEILKKAFDV